MPTPFAFLQAEWPAVYESASKAAGLAYSDPRTACFYPRRGLELIQEIQADEWWQDVTTSMANATCLAHQAWTERVD